MIPPLLSTTSRRIDLSEALIDPDMWTEELPLAYACRIVPPVAFEEHIDALSFSRKVVGRDMQGQRCYVRHEHAEVEQRFDIDEFPLEVTVGRERHIAWRLHSGRWLMQVDRLHRLDSCRPRREHCPPVELAEEQLGL